MRPGKSYRTIDVPAPAGFTLLELMIVMAILAIVAAITLVSVARARTNADATSAINSLRTIVSAQAAFRTACGHGRDYATTLKQLGADQMISPDLGASDQVTKAGYLIVMTGTEAGQSPDGCQKTDTAGHWYASATPVVGAGLPAFAVTDDGEIWRDTSGVPPKPPFEESKTVTRLTDR